MEIRRFDKFEKEESWENKENECDVHVVQQFIRVVGEDHNVLIIPNKMTSNL